MIGASGHRGDLGKLGLNLIHIVVREGYPDTKTGHILPSFRRKREKVSRDVDPATVPARTLEHGAGGLLQLGVGVSGMSNLTPSSPRVLSDRRRPVRKHSVSPSLTSKPRTIRLLIQSRAKAGNFGWETPVHAPSAATKSSTLRVETPWTLTSITTVNNAWSVWWQRFCRARRS